jgi:hypothetical protein
MSEQSKSIRELIQELANDPAAELYSKPCEVIEVDESARTCDVRPYDGTADIYNVRLQASVGSETGVVLIPKTGSAVLVTFISKTRAHVALTEQLEKILIDCEEITFNGGEFGGWFKAPDVNVELNKLTTRMQALETAILTYASAQAGVAGGVPVFAPLVGALSALNASVGALPPQGTFNDALIDDKITH